MTLLPLLFLACASSDEPPASSDGPMAAVATPEIAWTPVDGPGVTRLLTTAGDRVSVVNFWASWCGPCVRELPMLQEYARRNPEIRVILVNVDNANVQPTAAVPLIRSRQLDKVEHRFLTSDNPLVTLNEAVTGWPGRIPLTTVVDRSGVRTATWIEELPMRDLDSAVRAASSNGTDVDPQTAHE